MIIRQQYQDLPNNCVSACLAMISGKSVNEVTAEFHDGYHNRDIDIYEYLDALGIRFIKKYPCEKQTLKKGFVYLLAVPSLNIVGGMHEIVVDFSGDDAVILDPAPEEKNRYEDFGQSGTGRLCSWIIDAEFHVGELINKRIA